MCQLDFLTRKSSKRSILRFETCANSIFWPENRRKDRFYGSRHVSTRFFDPKIVEKIDFTVREQGPEPAGFLVFYRYLKTKNQTRGFFGFFQKTCKMAIDQIYFDPIRLISKKYIINSLSDSTVSLFDGYLFDIAQNRSILIYWKKWLFLPEFYRVFLSLISKYVLFLKKNRSKLIFLTKISFLSIFWCFRNDFLPKIGRFRCTQMKTSEKNLWKTCG